MKKSPQIPGWVFGLAIAVVVVVLGFFGFKYIGGEGPRDPSTFPKEAFKPPAFTNPSGYTYTRDGKPVNQPGPPNQSQGASNVGGQ